MRTLKVNSGPAQGTTLTVDRELVIGREGADLAIDDVELSRRHAAVRPVDGGIEVEDFGSTNGTYVDGRRVDGRVTVTHPARIRVGSTDLELLGEPTAAGGPPAGGAAPGGPPRLGAVVGGVAALVAIGLIVVFALAARGASTTNHRIHVSVRTTELYFILSRVGFSGIISGPPVGSGTLTQDQTFGGRPQDILKGPTPVTAKLTARFPEGTVLGTLTATARPTKAGGALVRGSLRWTDGTGRFKHVSGSATIVGGRPDIRIPIAKFDIRGTIRY